MNARNHVYDSAANIILLICCPCLESAQRIIRPRTIMVGKGGHLGEGSRNFEICRYGYNCAE